MTVEFGRFAIKMLKTSPLGCGPRIIIVTMVNPIRNGRASFLFFKEVGSPAHEVYHQSILSFALNNSESIQQQLFRGVV